MAAHLIIEVDGSQHGDMAGKARDDVRTRWLEREGYRVIRFWNNDLTENMEGVLEVIHNALRGSSDPDALTLKHKRRTKLD
jgi:very-short-patch-repair endonuclease